MSFDVKADGQTQVLTISDYVEEKSLYKLRRKGTGSVSRQDSVMGTEAFEAVTDRMAPAFSFDIDIAGIGISLISKKLVEVAYTTLNGLRFEYSNSSVAQALNLSVEVMQIDNQLHEGIYPVVLQPTPVAKQARKNGTPPCLQASIILLNDQGELLA